LSTRRLTDEQFADGTSIDGDRIDRALEDVVRHVNDIPPRDIERRFVQTQFVSGQIPMDFGVAQVGVPFMRGDNVAAEVVGGAPDSFENVRRAKGTFHQDQLTPWTWTQAASFRRPVIVVQMDWLLLTDTTFNNALVYDTSPPSGKTNGDSVDDIAVTLTVDSPFAAETRTEDALVLVRRNFKASAENVSLKSPVGFTDMNPTHPTSADAALDGVWIQLRDIVVPIPKNARVRWSLTIPKWDGLLNPWGAEPWMKQLSNSCMTLLEEIEP